MMTILIDMSYGV